MRSLFVRVFLALLVAVGISHLLATVVWTVWLRHAQRDEVAHRTREEVTALAKKLEATPEANRRAVVDAFERDYYLPVRLVPAEGDRTTGISVDVPPPHPAGTRAPPPLRPPETMRVALSGGETLIAPLYLPPPPPPKPTVPLLEAFVVLGLVAAVGWALARPMVRDLQAVESTVARLDAEDLDARVAPLPTGALAPLAEGVNAMASRLQRALAGQRQLLQAVSHELRTPNARIRFALETLRDTPDPEERAKLFDSIDDDIGEADTLLEELLTYLRFDVLQAEADPFDPRLVLEVVSSRMKRLAGEIALETDLAPDLPELRGSSRWFAKAIENLVTNAIRHAKGRVRIGAARLGGAVVVDVDDDGPGVPAEARARLFEPFTSSEPSRSRELGGVGLGLAIVRRITEMHHGGATILDAPLGGARFRTTWPIPPA